jgi:hypothetical protein
MRRRDSFSFLLLLVVIVIGGSVLVAYRQNSGRGSILYSKFPQTESLLLESSGKRKPKIGFLFLTTRGLEFEELWKAWFERNEDRALILIHCDKAKDNETTEWFNQHRTRSTVKTAWGHQNLTKAMILLLDEAFSRDFDGSIAKVVFLSESCVPLQTFDDCYNLLLADPYCWLSRTVDQLPRLMNFPKASQWIALNRDVLMLAKNFSLFDYYSKRASEWNLLTDEFYFANLVEENNMWLPIQNRTMTWLKWTEGASSPVTFSSQADLESIQKYLIQAKYSGVLFARKFSRDSHYETLGLHTMPLSNKTSVIFTPYVSKAGIVV